MCSGKLSKKAEGTTQDLDLLLPRVELAMWTSSAGSVQQTSSRPLSRNSLRCQEDSKLPKQKKQNHGGFQPHTPSRPWACSRTLPEDGPARGWHAVVVRLPRTNISSGPSRAGICSSAPPRPRAGDLYYEAPRLSPRGRPPHRLHGRHRPRSHEPARSQLLSDAQDSV